MAYQQLAVIEAAVNNDVVSFTTAPEDIATAARNAKAALAAREQAEAQLRDAQNNARDIEARYKDTAADAVNAKVEMPSKAEMEAAEIEAIAANKRNMLAAADYNTAIGELFNKLSDPERRAAWLANMTTTASKLQATLESDKAGAIAAADEYAQLVALSWFIGQFGEYMTPPELNLPQLSATRAQLLATQLYKTPVAMPSTVVAAG
jgi:DNA repair ATPase RecN